MSTYKLTKIERRKIGISVVDQEWKNLIVLDACRFDFFQKFNNIPGKLSKAISRGTSTNDWIINNFPDFYPNIVYVSGNPYITKSIPLPYVFKGREHFSYVREVWRDKWSEKAGTVTAGVICDVSLETQELFPKHRMIIHFAQPHEPFIGRVKFSSNNYPSVFEAWLKGDKIDYSELRLAYASNLKYVLEKVEKLLPKLKGKTVITSDHGELLGEMGLFGHYAGWGLSKLTEIPWFIPT